MCIHIYIYTYRKAVDVFLLLDRFTMLRQCPGCFAQQMYQANTMCPYRWPGGPKPQNLHHGRMKFLRIHPAHGQLRGHVLDRQKGTHPHPVLVGTGAIIVIVCLRFIIV